MPSNRNCVEAAGRRLNGLAVADTFERKSNDQAIAGWHFSVCFHRPRRAAARSQPRRQSGCGPVQVRAPAGDRGACRPDGVPGGRFRPSPPARALPVTRFSTSTASDCRITEVLRRRVTRSKARRRTKAGSSDRRAARSLAGSSDARRCLVCPFKGNGSMAWPAFGTAGKTMVYPFRLLPGSTMQGAIMRAWSAEWTPTSGRTARR